VRSPGTHNRDVISHTSDDIITTLRVWLRLPFSLAPGGIGLVFAEDGVQGGRPFLEVARQGPRSDRRGCLREDLDRKQTDVGALLTRDLKLTVVEQVFLTEGVERHVNASTALRVHDQRRTTEEQVMQRVGIVRVRVDIHRESCVGHKGVSPFRLCVVLDLARKGGGFVVCEDIIRKQMTAAFVDLIDIRPVHDTWIGDEVVCTTSHDKRK
jgi:hypothetical protein